MRRLGLEMAEREVPFPNDARRRKEKPWADREAAPIVTHEETSVDDIFELRAEAITEVPFVRAKLLQNQYLI